MFQKRTAVLGITASALLAGGVAAAPTALADSDESEAYGVAADGIVSVPPTPHVTGSEEETLADIDLNGLARSGTLSAEAEDGFAVSSVEGLELLGLLDLQGQARDQNEDPLSDLVSPDLGGASLASAGVIEAKCEEGEGSTSVADLQVAGLPINAEVDEPNQTVVPEPLEGIAQITLNKQESVGDGMTQVTGVSVDVLDGTQSVDLASATCGESADDDNGDDNGDGDNGDDDGDNGGGKAPEPTPQPGHLPVTG